MHQSQVHRRGFIKTMLAANVAPMFIPSHLLRGQGAPSNQITLGVIGTGAQGSVDLRAFLNHADVRVAALCDVNKRNLEAALGHVRAARKESDVKLVSDFRELNRDPSIDAVLMALPVHWHSIAAADAIQNGKHIYHEKPMGMSVEEAKVVRAIARKKGVVFQFGTQQRSDFKFRWACELARNGRLGKLKEIQVAVEGGIQTERFPKEPVPEHVDWERWVGPAPEHEFSPRCLQRRFHENMTHFSLGMISCWGIHHLDIANWGNDTDTTGPTSVQASGAFPESGSCDAVLRWNARFEFAKAAPIIFASEGGEIAHGIRFVGENGWVHVRRGQITASDEQILRDPQNKAGSMPVRLDPESLGCCGGAAAASQRASGSDDHTRKFVDAIRTSTPANCDVETAVRSDTLCQLALIAVKQAGRRLEWDPFAEQFASHDQAANDLLKTRPFRGDWRLPTEI